MACGALGLARLPVTVFRALVAGFVPFATFRQPKTLFLTAMMGFNIYKFPDNQNPNYPSHLTFVIEGEPGTAKCRS